MVPRGLAAHGFDGHMEQCWTRWFFGIIPNDDESLIVAVSNLHADLGTVSDGI